MTQSSLPFRIQSASDAILEKHFESWCEETEKSKDYQAFALLLSRSTITTSSGNQQQQQTRSVRLVNSILDVMEKTHQGEAILAFERILTVNPSRLTKYHPRLKTYFQQRLGIDHVSARCFACLPGCLSSRLSGDEFKRTLDALVDSCTLSVATKDLRGFQSASQGVVAFLNGAGREGTMAEFDFRPSPVVKFCRDAVDVNSDFSLVSLHVLKQLVTRLGRTLLPWSAVLCDTLELSFDASHEQRATLRDMCFDTAAVFVSRFGLGVGTRLAKSVLCKTVQEDWSSAAEQSTSCSIKAVNALYATGACTLMASKARTELDQCLVRTCARVCADGSVDPTLKCAFLHVLASALVCPVEGAMATAVTRQALAFLHALRSDNSTAVQDLAKQCLQVCSSSSRSGQERRFAVVVAASTLTPAHPESRMMMEVPSGDEEEEEEPSSASPVSSIPVATTTTTTKTSPLRAADLLKRPRLEQTQPDSSSDDDDIPEIV